MTQNNATLSPAKQELTARNFSDLIGMEGFSERMLTTHFKLYEAYVKNTNLLFKKWEEFRAKGDFSDPAFGETKRRFGWEYNSVKLHEHYFGTLGKDKSDYNASSFKNAVSEQFGSFDQWKNEFLGVAGTRGIGWVVLYRDQVSQRLINCWIDEHNNGHLIQSEPILVLDVFEHAFLIDYGVDKKKYLEAFMKNVQWDKVDLRLTAGQ
jgi:Fe-Mn family superoxide dismutase